MLTLLIAPMGSTAQNWSASELVVWASYSSSQLKVAYSKESGLTDQSLLKYHALMNVMRRVEAVRKWGQE